jgi:hypothetical protein
MMTAHVRKIYKGFVGYVTIRDAGFKRTESTGITRLIKQDAKDDAEKLVAWYAATHQGV